MRRARNPKKVVMEERRIALPELWRVCLIEFSRFSFLRFRWMLSTRWMAKSMPIPRTRETIPMESWVNGTFRKPISPTVQMIAMKIGMIERIPILNDQ